MRKRHARRRWGAGRKLAFGHAVGGLLLLGALAMRAPTTEAWLWSALLLLMSVLVSLRSALVWAYRRDVSRLPWALQPGLTEHEFGVAYLIYAIVFAAFPLLLLFL